jgi:hypothetical protein
MSNARTVIAVAKKLMARHGGNAAALMDGRAQENARAGDRDAAAFWARVAQAIRALNTKPESDQNPFALAIPAGIRGHPASMPAAVAERL